MTSFFHSEERRVALWREAQSWIGTPFFPHGKIKGAGVDCVQLAAQIYIATGFLDAFSPGAYAMDGGRHAGVSKVIEWIERSGKFSRVAPDSGGCEAGDLVCFRVGKSKIAWHVGVFIGSGKFVHSIIHRVVAVGDLNNLQAIRVVAIYRPMEARA